MREDAVKVITCQTDDGGASPPVNITWKHLSPLGAIEKWSDDMVINQEVTLGPQGGLVTKSSLRIHARRRLNGHRIECALELPDRMLFFRQTETLEVLCEFHFTFLMKRVICPDKEAFHLVRYRESVDLVYPLVAKYSTCLGGLMLF